jgi:hypothetical protein
MPTMVAPQTVTTPGIDQIGSAAPSQPAPRSAVPAPQAATSAQPGFGF